VGEMMEKEYLQIGGGAFIFVLIMIAVFVHIAIATGLAGFASGLLCGYAWHKLKVKHKLQDEMMNELKVMKR
jgi:hypothetical protein